MSSVSFSMASPLPNSLHPSDGKLTKPISFYGELFNFLLKHGLINAKKEILFTGSEKKNIGSLELDFHDYRPLKEAFTDHAITKFVSPLKEIINVDSLEIHGLGVFSLVSPCYLFSILSKLTSFKVNFINKSFSENFLSDFLTHAKSVPLVVSFQCSNKNFLLLKKCCQQDGCEIAENTFQIVFNEFVFIAYTEKKIPHMSLSLCLKGYPFIPSKGDVFFDLDERALILEFLHLDSAKALNSSSYLKTLDQIKDCIRNDLDLLLKKAFLAISTKHFYVLDDLTFWEDLVTQLSQIEGEDKKETVLRTMKDFFAEKQNAVLPAAIFIFFKKEHSLCLHFGFYLLATSTIPKIEKEKLTLQLGYWLWSLSAKERDELIAKLNPELNSIDFEPCKTASETAHAWFKFLLKSRLKTRLACAYLLWESFCKDKTISQKLLADMGLQLLESLKAVNLSETYKVLKYLYEVGLLNYTKILLKLNDFADTQNDWEIVRHDLEPLLKKVVAEVTKLGERAVLPSLSARGDFFAQMLLNLECPALLESFIMAPKLLQLIGNKESQINLFEAACEWQLTAKGTDPSASLAIWQQAKDLWTISEEGKTRSMVLVIKIMQRMGSQANALLSKLSRRQLPRDQTKFNLALEAHCKDWDFDAIGQLKLLKPEQKRALRLQKVKGAVEKKNFKEAAFLAKRLATEIFEKEEKEEFKELLIKILENLLTFPETALLAHPLILDNKICLYEEAQMPSLLLKALLFHLEQCEEKNPLLPQLQELLLNLLYSFCVSLSKLEKAENEKFFIDSGTLFLNVFENHWHVEGTKHQLIKTLLPAFAHKMIFALPVTTATSLLEKMKTYKIFMQKSAESLTAFKKMIISFLNEKNPSAENLLNILLDSNYIGNQDLEEVLKCAVDNLSVKTKATYLKKLLFINKAYFQDNSSFLFSLLELLKKEALYAELVDLYILKPSCDPSSWCSFWKGLLDHLAKEGLFFEALFLNMPLAEMTTNSLAYFDQLVSESPDLVSLQLIFKAIREKHQVKANLQRLLAHSKLIQTQHLEEKALNLILEVSEETQEVTAIWEMCVFTLKVPISLETTRSIIAFVHRTKLTHLIGEIEYEKLLENLISKKKSVSSVDVALLKALRPKIVSEKAHLFELDMLELLSKNQSKEAWMEGLRYCFMYFFYYEEVPSLINSFCIKFLKLLAVSSESVREYEEEIVAYAQKKYLVDLPLAAFYLMLLMQKCSSRKSLFEQRRCLIILSTANIKRDLAEGIRQNQKNLMEVLARIAQGAEGCATRRALLGFFTRFLDEDSIPKMEYLKKSVLLHLKEAIQTSSLSMAKEALDFFMQNIYWFNEEKGELKKGFLLATKILFLLAIKQKTFPVDEINQVLLALKARVEKTKKISISPLGKQILSAFVCRVIDETHTNFNRLGKTNSVNFFKFITESLCLAEKHLTGEGGHELLPWMEMYLLIGIRLYKELNEPELLEKIQKNMQRFLANPKLGESLREASQISLFANLLVTIETLQIQANSNEIICSAIFKLLKLKNSFALEKAISLFSKLVIGKGGTRAQGILKVTKEILKSIEELRSYNHIPLVVIKLFALEFIEAHLVKKLIDVIFTGLRQAIARNLNLLSHNVVISRGKNKMETEFGVYSGSLKVVFSLIEKSIEHPAARFSNSDLLYILDQLIGDFYLTVGLHTANPEKLLYDVVGDFKRLKGFLEAPFFIQPNEPENETKNALKKDLLMLANGSYLIGQKSLAAVSDLIREERVIEDISVLDNNETVHAVVQALKQDDVAEAKKYIEMLLPLNLAVNKKNLCSLACAFGSIKILDWLVADYEQLFLEDHVLLKTACDAENLPILDRLLKLGLSFKMQDENLYEILSKTVERSKDKTALLIFKKLFKALGKERFLKGCKPQAMLGLTTLIHECVKYQRSKTLRFLLEIGFPADFKKLNGNTILHDLCDSPPRNDELIKTVFQASLDPNQKNQAGDTIFSLILKTGSIVLLDFFFTNEEKLLDQCHGKGLLLELAKGLKDPKLYAEIYLKKLIQLSFKFMQMEEVKKFLDRPLDKHGNLLHYAARNGCFDLVDIILEARADPFARCCYPETGDSLTALDMVLKEDSVSLKTIDALLKKYSCPLSVSSDESLFVHDSYFYPLHFACRYEPERQNGELKILKGKALPKTKPDKIVKKLLAYGFPLTSQDRYGKTPLHYALEYGSKELKEYLIAYASSQGLLSTILSISDENGKTVLSIAEECSKENFANQAILKLLQSK